MSHCSCVIPKICHPQPTHIDKGRTNTRIPPHTNYPSRKDILLKNRSHPFLITFQTPTSYPSLTSHGCQPTLSFYFPKKFPSKTYLKHHLPRRARFRRERLLIRTPSLVCANNQPTNQMGLFFQSPTSLKKVHLNLL